MTEEQFEALKRWVHCVASAQAMRLDGGGGMTLSVFEENAQLAERDAREAFLGRVWDHLA